MKMRKSDVDEFIDFWAMASGEYMASLFSTFRQGDPTKLGFMPELLRNLTTVGGRFEPIKLPYNISNFGVEEFFEWGLKSYFNPKMRFRWNRQEELKWTELRIKRFTKAAFSRYCQALDLFSKWGVFNHIHAGMVMSMTTFGFPVVRCLVQRPGGNNG